MIMCSMTRARRGGRTMGSTLYGSGPIINPRLNYQELEFEVELLTQEVSRCKDLIHSIKQSMNDHMGNFWHFELCFELEKILKTKGFL